MLRKLGKLLASTGVPWLVAFATADPELTHVWWRYRAEELCSVAGETGPDWAGPPRRPPVGGGGLGGEPWRHPVPWLLWAIAAGACLSASARPADSSIQPACFLSFVLILVPIIAHLTRLNRMFYILRPSEPRQWVRLADPDL